MGRQEKVVETVEMKIVQPVRRNIKTGETIKDALPKQIKCFGKVVEDEVKLGKVIQVTKEEASVLGNKPYLQQVVATAEERQEMEEAKAKKEEEEKKAVEEKRKKEEEKIRKEMEKTVGAKLEKDIREKLEKDMREKIEKETREKIEKEMKEKADKNEK